MTIAEVGASYIAPRVQFCGGRRRVGVDGWQDMTSPSALGQGEGTIRVWPDYDHLRTRHLTSPTAESPMLGAE